jgi:hypothetical protein
MEIRKMKVIPYLLYTSYYNIGPVQDPIFITYEYLNKVKLFRNVNLIGDCYVSHRGGVTDYYKIQVLKHICQEYRKYYKAYNDEYKASDESQKKIEQEKKDQEEALLNKEMEESGEDRIDNTKQIEENQIVDQLKPLDTQAREELKKEDLFSSKKLLEIVKEKFTKCQVFIEEFVLNNEDYYSNKRKKNYKIIPIQIDPPKIELENDVQGDIDA